MPPRATKRQGTIKSFDAFRVAKSTTPSQKNLKNPPSFQQSSSDVQLDPESADLKPIIPLSSEPSLESEPSIVVPAARRPDLDESDESYRRAAQTILNEKRTPILHSKPNTIETILRDFDMTGKYGPCVGITRLQRFNRAKKLKMSPPELIGQILESQQAHEKNEYKHEVSHEDLIKS